jgi:hypothetical protein
MGRRRQRRQTLQSIRPWWCHTGRGRLPAIATPIGRLIDGRVNRDASCTESLGPSLRRRSQLAASCRRGVFRLGARAGPARTAAHAVSPVLAEQDRSAPRGVRWLQSGRTAGTGLTGIPRETQLALRDGRADPKRTWIAWPRSAGSTRSAPQVRRHATEEPAHSLGDVRTQWRPGQSLNVIGSQVRLAGALGRNHRRR